MGQISAPAPSLGPESLWRTQLAQLNVAYLHRVSSEDTEVSVLKNWKPGLSQPLTPIDSETFYPPVSHCCVPLLSPFPSLGLLLLSISRMEDMGVLHQIKVFELHWLLARPGRPVLGMETLLQTCLGLIRAQSQAWLPPPA